MSECYYFLKAQFLNQKTAKTVEKQLNAFFWEAQKAYWFWQDSPLEEQNFWKEYAKQFPRMMEYAQIIGAKNRSDLSRKCDFGSEEELIRENNIIGRSAEIGGMSDWSPLANFIKKKYGAVRVVWSNEENGIGSLDSLKLYDYEEIVSDILKHKELLPLLIGINEELTILLEPLLKGKKP
jgi:hypothetical protein